MGYVSFREGNQNDALFEKEIHVPNHHFGIICLNFRGVFFRKKSVREVQNLSFRHFQTES